MKILLTLLVLSVVPLCMGNKKLTCFQCQFENNLPVSFTNQKNCEDDFDSSGIQQVTLEFPNPFCYKVKDTVDGMTITKRFGQNRGYLEDTKNKTRYTSEKWLCNKKLCNASTSPSAYLPALLLLTVISFLLG